MKNLSATLWSKKYTIKAANMPYPQPVVQMNSCQPNKRVAVDYGTIFGRRDRDLLRRELLRYWPASFYPDTALFRYGRVNLQVFLCGVKGYASAQLLDFLATTKNCSFPI